MLDLDGTGFFGRDAAIEGLRSLVPLLKEAGSGGRFEGAAVPSPPLRRTSSVVAQDDQV